ncbi:MAG: 6-bladed beta-propeller [Gemmatimonadetes bacterium]|nr:6-bladed beta-propeller [Gemmatimonadota bacterium]
MTGRRASSRPATVVRIGLLAALFALASAGSEAAALQSQFSVTDSAGIRITTSDAADRDAGAVCSLAEAADTRVASPASGEWTLYGIEDLDRMEDGRLVLVNRGSRELLMFGRDGKFLRSVGGSGEGPGEFMDPIELDFVAGDSIVAWDWRSGRLELFGPDGSPGRSVRLDPPVPNPAGYVGVIGGEGIAIASHDVRQFDTQLVPQFLQILRYDWGGRLLDTLATLPYGELGLLAPGSRRMSRPAFESRGVFSTHGDLLYTSDGASPEVRVHRGERLERIVRWDPGDLSVRADDGTAYSDARLEGVADDLAPAIRRSLNAFPPKDTFPAVTEIRIDPRGRLWIRTFARPGSTANEWLGFAETGAFICSLSVPRAFAVFHFDSAAVVGVHKDEMDVESLEVRSFTVPR